jgi:diaminopimelate epimerase
MRDDMSKQNVIPYIKADACGNDFLLIESMYAPIGDEAVGGLTRLLCDRLNGIGADGIEWIYSEPTDSDAEVRIRLFNADGSKAEISGNGTRCVAALWVSQHGGAVVRIRTDAGVKECKLISATHPSYTFETKIGKPSFEGPFEFQSSAGTMNGILLNIGNPQCVVFVDEFPSQWQLIGAEIQSLPQFEEGVNVDFVKIVGPQSIECRFFERGAGETKSSGTGSSASAFAAIHSGKVNSPVEVRAPGGTQSVRWSEDIYLTGPAEIVSRGEITL